MITTVYTGTGTNDQNMFGNLKEITETFIWNGQFWCAMGYQSVATKCNLYIFGSEAADGESRRDLGSASK